MICKLVSGKLQDDARERVKLHDDAREHGKLQECDYANNCTLTLLTYTT